MSSGERAGQHRYLGDVFSRHAGPFVFVKCSEKHLCLIHLNLQEMLLEFGVGEVDMSAHAVSSHKCPMNTQIYASICIHTNS